MLVEVPRATGEGRSIDIRCVGVVVEGYALRKISLNPPSEVQSRNAVREFSRFRLPFWWSWCGIYVAVVDVVVVVFVVDK